MTTPDNLLYNSRIEICTFRLKSEASVLFLGISTLSTGVKLKSDGGYDVFKKKNSLLFQTYQFFYEFIVAEEANY